MSNESRRIRDFIMGGCAGFCLFYGGIIGYGIGSIMLLTFGVTTYRERMLAQIDKDIERDLKEEKDNVR